MNSQNHYFIHWCADVSATAAIR